MLGKDAKLRNRRLELRQFLDGFTLDKPRRKFFLQSLWGILMSSSLIVSRWLRWLACADRCKDRFWRHKRLLNQLHNPNWKHEQVQEQHLLYWGQRVEPDTPLIIDLCDLAKPRAKKLKYLALVRDGSEDGRLVNGYWCLEAYAYWGKSRITPLLLHPYSIEDPEVKSENQQILRGIEQVYAATAGKGVLVFDAGGDRDALLIPWIDAGHRFVIRTRGDRHLLLDDGTGIEAKLLAETLLAKAAKDRPGHQIIWQRVYLPERPGKPLYLVAKSIQGKDRPLMLLTALTAQNLESAKQVLVYYRRRWKCEEAARFLKSELGLERFCIRTYESFPRLLFLATLAMSFLTWLQLKMPTLTKWLCKKCPGRRKIKFAYYRLVQWLKEQILPAQTLPAPP